MLFAEKAKKNRSKINSKIKVYTSIITSGNEHFTSSLENEMVEEQMAKGVAKDGKEHDPHIGEMHIWIRIREKVPKA